MQLKILVRFVPAHLYLHFFLYKTSLHQSWWPHPQTETSSGGEDEDEDWIEPSKAVGNRRKVRFYKCLVIQCRIIKIPAHFATLSCRETRILPDETVEEATHLVSRAPLLLPRVTPTKTRWTLIQEYRRHHLDTKIWHQKRYIAFPFLRLLF